MASEALLRASAKAFHGSLKASEASSCSFLPSRKAQVFRLHQHHISSAVVSSRRAICCQTIAPLAKPERKTDANSCGLGQQSCSPDRWVEDCVYDIVRNINEAPFMHMLFDPADRRSSVTTQRRRVVGSDDWSVEDKWKEVRDSVTTASPDGVILVHHLGDDDMQGCCLRDGSFPACMKVKDLESSKMKGCCSPPTNLWGVLVLGKSVARSACYILKTTSVASSSGTCTQFCLTKAQCFGPAWNDQLQNSWLLNTESNEHSN